MSIEQLKKSYIDWTSRKIEFKNHDSFIEVKIPFVDMKHDYIHLFFEKTDDGYSLGDDGYILDELDTLGVNIQASSVKYKAFFEQTLRIFGVKFNKKTLELYVTFNNVAEYPLKQHQLIQCMIMLMTSRQRVDN